MVTQLRALGQWEVVNGTIHAHVPAGPDHQTQEETRQTEAWELRAARAYAENTLRLEDDYGEVISTITDPCTAWITLERSYGSQQSGIQAVINAELTLSKWDGISPIAVHRDYMKGLRNSPCWRWPCNYRSTYVSRFGTWFLFGDLLSVIVG